MDGQNQHLRVFVSKYAAPSNKANIDAMTDPATGLPGSIGILGADGKTLYATVAAALATGFVQLAHYDAKKNLYLGQRFAANEIMSNTELIDGVAEVPMEVKATVIPGQVAEYVVKLTFLNYGGMYSPSNEVNVYGNFFAKDGATAAEIAEGLGVSLTKSLSRRVQGAAVVDTSANDGTIKVTAIPQAYESSKFDGSPLDMRIAIASPEEAWAAGEVVKPYHPGKNTGKQVATKEEFYAGYNEGWENRHRDWPANITPLLSADPSVPAYKSISLTGGKNTLGASVVSQRQDEVAYFGTEALPA